jgi:Golgi phosphoprotein 3
MLGFVEEIVLLQLDERGRLIELPLSAADVVLAGAALMELALRNKVDTDINRFFVVDREPTGDEILDDALGALIEEGGNSLTSPAIERISLTTSAAIERITVNARRYRDIALRRLVEKGVLREEEGRFLWVFHTRRYPVIDDTEQREVRARLRELILTDEIPDPRDVVLVCLIDACGLLGLVLSLDEIALRRTRIEQLTRLDLIGQAMTKAVGEIRFIIQYATAPIH